MQSLLIFEAARCQSNLAESQFSSSSAIDCADERRGDAKLTIIPKDRHFMNYISFGSIIA
jgi:hypothetical protein